MGAYEDLTGRRFGRLLVLEPSRATGGLMWLCRCDCGASSSVTYSNLSCGGTQSCGCRQREIATAQFTQHGHARIGQRTPTYNSWYSMIRRCTDPKRPQWPHYGGRGITVCKQWMDFANFLADMGARPSLLHGIERKDNNGHYEPGNCKWATQREQGRNRRNNRMIRVADVIATLVEWAELTGMHPDVIARRIDRFGYSERDAIMLPLRGKSDHWSKEVYLGRA